MTLSLTLASMCQICYDDNDESTVSFFNNTFQVETIRYDNAIAKCFQNDRFIIICFAGTNDFEDLLSDIDFIEIPFMGINGVHKGFHREFKKLKPHVDRVIGCTTKQIILTGHSLGASIAYLTACDWCSKVTCLVVFGMPKTATPAFVFNAAIKSLVIIRWVNGLDKISSFPSSRFVHCGFKRYLPDRRSCLKRFFRPRAYHKIKNYIIALSNHNLISEPYESILSEH